MNRWIVLSLLTLGLILAAGALFTQWRSQWAQRQFPAAGAQFRLPQATLHYTDQGTGPVLVLLHGASTNLRDFFAIAPQLGQHYRIIAVDRPGSGYSRYHQSEWLDPRQQAALIASLLDHLGIRESVWAGHSLAGAVVMAGLLHQADQVRGGILISGAAYPWTSGVDFIDHLPGYPLVGPLSIRSVIIPAGHVALPAGIARAFAPEAPTPAYQAQSGIDLYLRPRQFAATARDIRNLSDFLARQSQDYARLSQPLLMIHGDQDDIVPAWNHADRLIKLKPDASYRKIAGGGHQPHHVHADQVVAWMHQFMQKNAPPSQPPSSSL